jgi:very-short-patch-repair endonuclease
MTRKPILSYDPNLKKLARRLRMSSTMSEVLLWRCLKGKQVLGYDFDRQKPIGKYIVDFYCKELRLAIEIDGATHNDKVHEDRMRQERLESLGVRFLRFRDGDVKRNLEGVIEEIRKWIKEKAPKPIPPEWESAPTPNPSREGIPTPGPSKEGI